MFNYHRVSIKFSLAAYMASAFCTTVAIADDITAFSTGGYARGLRTMSEMHKIDLDGDGSISRAEWLTYQERVFATLDPSKSGKVSEKQFLSPSSTLVNLATGGYARGLQTKEMMHKIDSNGDGLVSHDEYITYQTKLFDTMNKGHNNTVDSLEFLGK